VYAFDGPDASTEPPFRVMPSGWKRGSDYYNNFGFRGPDLTPRKSARAIRIAFLGASTTANGWPFTYPEYAGHFLRRWAKSAGLDVDIEVINAGRGGVNAPTIAKIMEYEVAPLHPDIVLYYEGANDMHTAPIVRMADGSAPVRPDPSTLQANMTLTYLPLEQYSALLDRIYEVAFRHGGPAGEPRKPPHRFTFDVTQKTVDLDRRDLPFDLHLQIANMRAMEAAAKRIGAQMFFGSFVTLARDGLLLDPDRHRIILQNLNGYYWPITYGELRQAVDYQNLAYRELARHDGVPFLEIDSHFPQDPDLFADVVHFNSQSGFRLHGWIVAQLLAPYIRDAITRGDLPKPAYDPDPKAIAWATADPVRFDLSCLH
jgi:hypothetical protein